MVDEAEVARLHRELRASLGGALAAQVARGAGLRTADYLLAHRIPKPVQALLKALPAPLAARVLLAAITRHAWTFAGSGEFSAQVGLMSRVVTLQIRNNPLCRGVNADAPACEACGDDACRFEVRWQRATSRPAPAAGRPA